ncbi:hypothetical protein [Methanothrix sp.]|jgi:hypothetical protein|uniref:hypothetical protein n=1 Tax=Methanothrix sp. TaxID=90426 RepID=UPI0027B1DB94|nr:hypothetical protein [Euryarchaeota archaeon]
MGLHEKYLRPDGENESIKMIGAPSGSIIDRKPSIHEIVWIFFPAISPIFSLASFFLAENNLNAQDTTDACDSIQSL